MATTDTLYKSPDGSEDSTRRREHETVCLEMTVGGMYGGPEGSNEAIHREI